MRISEADEGCGLSGVSLVVAAEAAVAADPSQRPLHNPALGQDHRLSAAGQACPRARDACAGGPSCPRRPVRMKDAPPFTAPLALWASMMAVVGLASPACSRRLAEPRAAHDLARAAAAGRCNQRFGAGYVLLRGRLETRLWGGWPGTDVIPGGCRSQLGRSDVDPGHPAAA
jgi:hypothetical protein